MHDERDPIGGAAWVVLAGVAIALGVTTIGLWTVITRSGATDATDAAGGEEAVRDAAAALARDRSVAVAPVAVAPAPVPPAWIWSSAAPGPDDVAWFRRRVETEEDDEAIVLRLSCDNRAVVRVDGEQVGTSDDWARPLVLDLAPHAPAGGFDLVVEAANEGGPAGLCAVIEITGVDGARRSIVTDETWTAAGDASFADARGAIRIGAFGDGPWGALSAVYAGDVDRGIIAPPGFVVELVCAVPRAAGSWVSLAVDGRGRLIASGERSGLHRITPVAAGGDPRNTIIEPIDVPVAGAQGLLEVEGELYCVVSGNQGRDGQGLYRVRDTDGDDALDEATLLRAIEGDGGEHGPHGIALGPDGMLYVVGGNHVALPRPERSTVPRTWDEDLLLPRLWDANGHAVGIMAPGGWICRTDRDGAAWEVVAIGFRNPYDIAFDPRGELFTYDADMEWDLGAPWYRPTRVNHVVSGAEFGWRSGSGKWPPEWPDSLPAVVDIGPGSPTGVLFGTDARFPARYRRALFLLDWTYGTIRFVDLEPDGASFRGRAGTFVAGRPFPVADAIISPVDGAMYVVLGGRGIASAIYRIRHPGTTGSDEPVAAVRAPLAGLRRQLERHHRDGAPESAVDEAWPHLAHPDRFVRWAARIAIEHQPAGRWMSRALAEPDPAARLQALIALARHPERPSIDVFADALESFDWDDLGAEDRVVLLRCWMLAFIRAGRPEQARARRIAATFEEVYPTGDDRLDRDLCDLLVYLGSPRVVARTIALMERADTSEPETADHELLERGASYGQTILAMAAAQPQRRQVHYALALRTARAGWTPDLRDRYFRWFETARRTRGGASFTGFLDAIRAEALANVPASQRARLEAIAGDGDPVFEVTGVAPEGPGRAWTVDGVIDLLGGGLAARDFDRGAKMLEAASCLRCHRFAGRGVAGGPDLTGVGSRFSVREIVEAIVEPSRVISDQYAQEAFILDDDTVLVGRVTSETDRVVTIVPSMLQPDAPIAFPTARIVERERSAVSPMMSALLDRMNPDEVLDLLAHLLTEGDERAGE